MKGFSIFKVPKHQQFHVPYRYYDPVKADIAERKKRMQSQMAAEARNPKHSRAIREAIASSYARRSKEQRRMVTTRLLIMIVLLALIFSYVYNSPAVYYTLGLTAVFVVYMRRRGVL